MCRRRIRCRSTTDFRSSSSTSRKRSSATGRRFPPTSASVLRTTGISGVEAEELAILPGMEELSAMMYINQYRREQRYDVIVLDAAPTAESLRFISMPTTLDWYMKHIFPFQRNLLKAVRPIANRVAPFELPDRQLLRQHPQSVRKAGRRGRHHGRPAHHQRPAGDQPREDGASRDAAGVCILLAARADGRCGHRQSRAAGRGQGRLVQRMARVAGQGSATRSKNTSRRCRSSACRYSRTRCWASSG